MFIESEILSSEIESIVVKLISNISSVDVECWNHVHDTCVDLVRQQVDESTHISRHLSLRVLYVLLKIP